MKIEEISIKLNVDTSELDKALKKTKELLELSEKLNNFNEKLKIINQTISIKKEDIEEITDEEIFKYMIENNII